ncbi:Structural maintenance of chromosomes protein 2 [Nymphon striatum]|nr:Structural maintenance of chromosomes protein 2 [Nymphon striatum]
MFVKLLVIDGFKSYGQRTEVNGFDRLFNAITGLNGSGKSNILDAICFVLGISNLTQVRATNLQELVYKSGQAGVNKATVSITFDNHDKLQSPMGYEQYDEITITRQVVIGGRNKYLINGCNATNTRVADLFQSVQLNVNNPHFLIMQGRITKVLNMKPPEILSMIEEAAGTRMYESKKQNAQKTITKKDAKLNEIDTILNEEITPTLTKLKAERSSYLEYQKIQREFENLNKLYIAYQFVTAQELNKKFGGELKEKMEENKTLSESVADNGKKVEVIEEKISAMIKTRDEEAGGRLKDIETYLKARTMIETKASAAVKHQKDAVNEEMKKKKEIEKSYQEDVATIKNKTKDAEKAVKLLEKLQETCQTDAENLETAQKRFQAISAGLSTNTDGQEATLADQLITAKTDIAVAETEFKQAEMKLKHAQVEVKKKEADCKKTELSYKKDKVNYDKLKSEVENIEVRLLNYCSKLLYLLIELLNEKLCSNCFLYKELNRLDYRDGDEEQLLDHRRSLSRKVIELNETVEGLEAKFPDLKFEYSDPEKGFDRKRIHGLVCKLIKVNNLQHTTALEVCAGGKLYNVVVDTEQTGKKLLQNGKLRRRFTIIPLNKISAHAINNQVVKKAESLVGKQNVYTALSLVGYKNQLLSAMEYVFGSSFVCSNMDSAMKVTFDKSIMTPSVTLEGDKMDPSGTLTGGSRRNMRSVLSNLTQLNDVIAEYMEKKGELEKLDIKLNSFKKVAEKYRNLKDQFDLKKHEFELLDTRLHSSTHHQQLEEVKSLHTVIEEQEETFARCKEIKKKGDAKVKDLEDKIKNAKSHRERELKAAQAHVNTCKKDAEKSNHQFKEKQQETESLKLEIQELESSLSSCKEQMEQVDKSILCQEEELARLNEIAQKHKEEVSQAQADLKQQKDLLRTHDKDITEQQKQRNSLIKSVNESKLRIQSNEHDINKYQKDAKESNNKVEQLLSNYDWIVEDKKYFGLPNTAYDFTDFKANDAGNRLQKLQETKDKMAKHVNMRAMNMLGQAEEQYNDLMKKKRIVENDKATIAAVIKELDEKKNEALKKAWQQINKDFGSIFSTLLPGTQAKLVPLEGHTILDGVEVKIAFGDVWKESLQELSGGQRSLVALSLILALLLFKPAPIYILDEVDAALDLNHTQNIGQMIRTHFKHSQFIVVSLKDGMFNNANVLFKTKFVDGMSTVNRFAQHSSKQS